MTKHMTKQMIIGLLALVFAAVACDSSDDDFQRKNQKPGDPNSEDPNVPKCTDVGTSHVGFGGTKLEDKRVNAKIGADHARLKPYSALKGEYERTIGVAPPSLEIAAPSFGNPPARFSSEPRASAIQVYSAFRVAFDGCLTYTETPAEFAAAPNDQSAGAQCTTMARKFWSRAPTKEEVDACKQVALTDSTSEPSPRRRWAYTCATLLSSAGFLTY
jgi:hypothetical protein